MIPVFTMLAKSLTGKVALGVAVTTLGVGAAAAAGAEMPTLSSAGAAEETDESTEELSGADVGAEFEDEQGNAESKDDEQGDAESKDDESENDESENDESENDESENDEESTHGAVVSEFTQGTELVGCEKGQATAAVARGDVDPSSPTLTDDLAPYLAKCGESGDDPEDDESDDADSEDADGSEWKDIRDDTKAKWHEAKDEYAAACGDDDDADDDEVEAGGDDERSPECDAMKAELKQLHRDGKDEWKDARDAEHAERKAERAESKAESKAERKAEKSSDQGKSGKD